MNDDRQLGLDAATLAAATRADLPSAVEIADNLFDFQLGVTDP